MDKHSISAFFAHCLLDDMEIERGNEGKKTIKIFENLYRYIREKNGLTNKENEINTMIEIMKSFIVINLMEEKNFRIETLFTIEKDKFLAYYEKKMRIFFFIIEEHATCLIINYYENEIVYINTGYSNDQNVYEIFCPVNGKEVELEDLDKGKIEEMEAMEKNKYEKNITNIRDFREVLKNIFTIKSENIIQLNKISENQKGGSCSYNSIYSSLKYVLYKQLEKRMKKT